LASFPASSDYLPVSVPVNTGWKIACLPIYLSIYLRIYNPLLDHGHFFSFLTFFKVGRTPWRGDQPLAWPLPAYRTAQTQNKHTQTSILEVGFELTIPVFERAKVVHVLNRATTVIG
jgi:hypothetical protein